jgi:hypothetical protein
MTATAHPNGLPDHLERGLMKTGSLSAAFPGGSASAGSRLRGGAVAAALLAAALAGPAVTPAASAGTHAAAAKDQWFKVPFTGHRQERSTWCGPAAAQTALTALGIGSYQKTLASKMHAGTFGTLPGNMPAPMNAYIKKKWSTNPARYKSHRYARHAGTGTGELWSWTRQAIIGKGMPVIILVKPKNIWYPGAGFGTAHYLVIYGYNNDYKGKGPTYAVYDPWDGGRHTLAKKDWGTGGRNVGYQGGNIILPEEIAH